MAEISSALTEELLKNFEQKKNVIADFKKSVSSLIDETAKNDIEKPLFIFIDELDRCRPIFAIELLEKIKHIFNITDVVFVVATDTTQLSHSVKAIYGHEFNGEIYLRRFFDQIYTLPKPDCVSFITMLFEDYTPKAKHFDYRVGMNGGWEANGKNEHTLTCDNPKNSGQILIFSLFSLFFDLDLRTNKQCFERLIAIESSFDDKQDFHFLYLIFLIMLNAKYPSKFQDIFSSQEREKYLKTINDSARNLLIYNEHYTSTELIRIHVKNVFMPKKELRKKLDHLDNTAYDSFEANLAFSLYENYQNILRYKGIVEMANTLT